MLNTLLIFLGAGIGGILRFWVSHIVYDLGPREYPYGTMFVNITGCLLMGILFIITTERFDTHGEPLRMLLLIGLLGGYTTYSSFALESLMLLENGRVLGFFCNVFLTTTLCLMATWIGILIGKNI